tara:strand:- start:18 stop:194 length:177 start_codon:yes stop_codon:yes gene_type:complete
MQVVVMVVMVELIILQEMVIMECQTPEVVEVEEEQLFRKVLAVVRVVLVSSSSHILPN